MKSTNKHKLATIEIVKDSINTSIICSTDISGPFGFSKLGTLDVAIHISSASGEVSYDVAVKLAQSVTFELGRQPTSTYF